MKFYAKKGNVGGPRAMKLNWDLHRDTVRSMQEYFIRNKRVANQWLRSESIVLLKNVADYREKTDILTTSVRKYEEEKMYEYMDQLGSGKSIPEEHLFFSLPMEVQLMVSEYMDTQTLLTCCLLSAKFRDFVQTTSKNYFHTVRVRIGANGHVALEVARENQEPEYFGVSYDVSWSSSRLQPVKGPNGQLYRLFSTQRSPTFQTPSRTSPVCLLKSLLPASSVEYLQIIPCPEEERKPSLFEDAADIAEYYMDSYVIMELSENPKPDVISTVLSRKTRLLLLCHLNATSLAVFRSFCIRDTPDVLIVREDFTVTVDPDYEELLEQLLGAPFSPDLHFRVFFSDLLKFDSFKKKFLAAQDNKYVQCDEQQGVKMYKIGDYDHRRLVFNDRKMCIMLVWVGMPRQN